MVDSERSGEGEVTALLRALRPEDYGGFSSEAWLPHRERIKHLLPNFPDVALKEWVWRHYGNAVSDYGWIGLPYLHFTPEAWPTDRILAAVHGWENHGLIEHWTKYLRENPDALADWLGSKMINEGTWPEPPMIIENSMGLARPDGLRLGEPFHLMEGHHRLCYLHALVADPRWQAQPEHRVLVVSVEESRILDYWPSYD
jgi:hypothetical protein